MSELKHVQQAINTRLRQLTLKLDQHSTTALGLYALLLFGGFILYQLLSPVRMGDTDMWYHLNGGRFFWNNHQIPDTSFFSFISPERQWTNYYWGFQALLYAVFDLSGYQGLVILRTLIVTLTAWMIFRFLVKTKTVNHNMLIVLILTGLIMILLDSRTYQLRPHLFSYLFIISFLYILEFKPRLVPLLPLMTVVWGNVHGIEWPAGALICGIYALQPLHRLFTKTAFEADRGWRYLTSLLLCAPALLINPYGWELYLAPFNVPADVYLYTSELQPLPTSLFYTVHGNGLYLTANNVLSLLLIIFPVSLVYGVIKGKLSLEHVLLAIGGIILLSKGSRFIWEWMLLGLPVIASLLKYRLLADHKITFPLPAGLFLLALISIPFATGYLKARDFGHYPFDARRLPLGSAVFMKKVGAEGKIMAPPSHAGFTEWQLYPGVKTFIDMEFPPFNAKDFYEIYAAYKSLTGMKKFIRKYDPEWIALPNNHTPSKDNIKKFSDYVPLFTDEAYTLYVDKQQYPDIAKQWKLEFLDPHNLQQQDDKKIDDVIRELKRLHEVFPQGERVNHLLARVFFRKKQFQQALEYAKQFQAINPNSPNSHYLAGICYQNLQQYDQAIAAYKKGLLLSDDSFKPSINRNIALSYYLKREFSQAIPYFQKGMNPYKRNEKPSALYAYAFSAAMTGDMQRAKTFLNMLLDGMEKKHGSLYENTRGLLEKVESGALDAPSIFDWLKHYFKQEKSVR